MTALSFSITLLGIVWAIAVAIGLRQGHYAFGFFLGLIGAYELLPVIITQLAVSGVLVSNNFLITFSRFADDEKFLYHTTQMAVFLVAFLITYTLNVGGRTKSAPRRIPRDVIDYWPVLLSLFVYGVVSVISGAGSARVADYNAEGGGFNAQVSKIHSVIFLGRGLLVVTVPLLIHALRRQSRLQAFLIILVVSPLLLELAIAGRRQVFAPSVLALLLYFLYSPQIRRKWLYFSVASAAFIVFAGLLFSQRGEFYQEAYGLDGFAAVYRPMFGEFVSITATSLWTESVVHMDEISYGLHFLSAALDSLIPYVKLAAVMQRATGVLDWSFDLERVAPFGGLSMYADAFLAFGQMAGLFLGVTLGATLSWIHRRIRRAVADPQQFLSYGNVWAFCVGATILMQYRSGIADTISGMLKFSFLYWAPLTLVKLFEIRAGRAPRGRQRAYPKFCV